MFKITESEKKRMEKCLDLCLDHPKTAFAEGVRRMANMFDDLQFIYAACSSGKDSTFMVEMAIVELQRRKLISQLYHGTKEENAEAKKLIEAWSKVRANGIASSRIDRIELCDKWSDNEEIAMNWERNHKSEWKYDGNPKHASSRIGLMQMSYEIDYAQSRELMLRMYKEYATDFDNIILDKEAFDQIDEENTILADVCDWGTLHRQVLEDLEKDAPSIWKKRKGAKPIIDVSWIAGSKDEKGNKCSEENPYSLVASEILGLKISEIREIYGKSLVFGFGCFFQIAWENTGSTSNSRYISFDQSKKDIWVYDTPDDFDKYHEWCITDERLYDTWHGCKPMFEVKPGMTDQDLRVEFSGYISNSIAEALEMGWPFKKFDEETMTYK